MQNLVDQSDYVTKATGADQTKKLKSIHLVISYEVHWVDLILS